MQANPTDRLFASLPRPGGLIDYLAAFALVALSTVVGLGIVSIWESSAVVLLYVPPVLAVAARGGRYPAFAAAIAGTLAFNFFFTAPYHTLLIANSGDVVTVAMLFVVALTTSHLAASLRVQAGLAAAHAARNAAIAGFARRLLSSSDEAAIAAVSAEELSRLFGCHVVIMHKGENPAIIAEAPPNAQLTPSDFVAAVYTLTTGEPAGRGMKRGDPADWQFHPIAAASGPLAVVGLTRDDGVPPISSKHSALLESLLDQTALALERARLEAAGRENVLLRERDSLRSTLLGSIGADARPRLHAIGAAIRAIRRTKSADSELVDTLARETSKLAAFVDNLVDLDPAEEQEPVVIGDVRIDLYTRTVTKAGQIVHLTPKEYAVLAELARNVGRILSHSYLLRAVWGPAHENHVEYLRVAISALRHKLADDAANPRLILNEPAVGYRLAHAGS